MLSLNIPPQKLFRWFGRLQLWAPGDWQLHHDNTPAHASHLVQEFFGETSNHLGDSAPYSPDLVPCDFWFFPKTIITFEREEIPDCRWDSGKYNGAADGDWENCVRSQGACFEGDWGVLVLRTMVLISCVFFNKCLYFSYCMAGYLLDRPRMLKNLLLIFLKLWNILILNISSRLSEVEV